MSENQSSIVVSPPSVKPQKTFKNRIGEAYGRLTIEAYLGRDKWNKAVWLCRCECGTAIEATTQNLVTGNTMSCRCLQSELMRSKKTIHGRTKTPVYAVWATMISRCTNPRNRRFRDYGGRGIRVCSGWRRGHNNMTGFECFISSMGERPRGMTIERRNNNSHYCCGGCSECEIMDWQPNCYWETREGQGNNKRNNRLFTLDGVTMSVTRWGKKFGISASRIVDRVQWGWSFEKAVKTPVRKCAK